MTPNAPRISPVPLSASTMDEATADFSLVVHEQAIDTSTNTERLTNTDSFNFWGYSVASPKVWSPTNYIKIGYFDNNHKHSIPVTLKSVR